MKDMKASGLPFQLISEATSRAPSCLVCFAKTEQLGNKSVTVSLLLQDSKFLEGNG